METQSSELIKEIQQATKTPTMLGVPRTIGNTIIPVIEVNPKVVKTGAVKTGYRTTSGGVTMLTTPAAQDLYVTDVSFSIIKDAACDLATGPIQITGTINAGQVSLIEIAGITLTAQSNTQQVHFSHPIKMDRNTSISITNQTYTAGVMIRTCTLSYFVDECSNGS